MLLGLCRTIAQLQQQLSDREAEAAGLQEKFESVLASLGDSTGTSADLLLTVKRWQRKLHDLTQSREKWRQQALGQRQQARGQIEQLLLAKQKLDLLVGKLGGGDPDLAVKRTLTKLERRTETLAKLSAKYQKERVQWLEAAARAERSHNLHATLQKQAYEQAVRACEVAQAAESALREQCMQQESLGEQSRNCRRGEGLQFSRPAALALKAI